jgi:hypothetical protein
MPKTPSISNPPKRLSLHNAPKVEAKDTSAHLTVKPLSITMGEPIMRMNAMGYPLAVGIVAEWAPKYRCVSMDDLGENDDVYSFRVVDKERSAELDEHTISYGFDYDPDSDSD